MSPRTVRIAVVLVCAVGIAGMIVGSIADNNGTAITFGLIAATASIGLILVTAVSGGEVSSAGAEPVGVDEEAAKAIEAKVCDLVESGVDESALRDLVRDAIRLGRGTRSSH